MREILGEVVHIARRCTKFGMCKVDYLGTGLCPPARRHPYASYFPQGRMEIAQALYDGEIPVTEEVVHIVRSCPLCQVCNRQCYFATQLKPLAVMRALRTYVDRYLEAGLPVSRPAPDPVLDRLQEIVGTQWASNDPAILVCYSQPRSPARPRQMPRYVVLPGTSEEVADIVRAARRHHLAIMPRGNGTSLAGVVCDGIVLDLARLREVTVDPASWSAEIGAGVTGFQLQRAAHEHGLRANTAEPAACVCANIISTNLHSLYSHSYGVGANDLIDAELVTFDGEVVRLDSPAGEPLRRYREQGASTPPAICTRARVKLHPVAADEQVAVVPFAERDQALLTARELCARRIGSAVGVVGVEYAATFTAVTEDDAAAHQQVLRDRLGINYLLIMVGDRYAMHALAQLSSPVLDQDLMRTLLLGLPNLRNDRGLEVLSDLSGSGALYRELFSDEMLPILRMALAPAPEAVTRSADREVRRFLTRLYAKPHMTDVGWLTTFRIVSARIGRGKTFVPRIVWVPIDGGLIENIVRDLAAIGDQHQIANGFGYLVPVELGKRAIVEFDYFFDQADPAQTASMVAVMAESQALLETYRNEARGVTLGSEIALQGLSRPESYLYR